jgi:adenylosuccinate lyase
MLANLELTRGLVFRRAAAQACGARCRSRGCVPWIQRNALRSWTEGPDFRELVSRDADISGALTQDEIEVAFDHRSSLKNVDRIFERVFGK